tara:strand:- start:646 stop:810 length:165 start_codon:yes stop_codon:yes gene_type:complete
MKRSRTAPQVPLKRIIFYEKDFSYVMQSYKKINMRFLFNKILASKVPDFSKMEN